MSYWFTSDLHFDHEKVITYANRPFKNALGEPDANLMNKTLIDNWNALVKPDDHVYVLGDVACASTPERIYNHVSQLQGYKYLVFGNHDKAIRKTPKILDLFKWARDFAEVKLAFDPAVPNRTQHITLCHFAMRVWNKSHHGAWNLYGHSHGNLADDPHALQLDVGVDEWDYRPVSFAQVQERMSKKTWKPIDHHGAKKDL